MIITRPSVGLYWYTDFDPTGSGGVAAPLGQLLIDQVAEILYWKSGAANTAWTAVGGSGPPPPANTIDVQDEGVALGAFDTLDFTGLGVTATDLGGGIAGIAIPGGATVRDEGVGLGFFTVFNFTGAGVTATNAGGGVTNITIPAGGMSIGGAVTGGTTGSVLYVAAGPVLAQDNANFFWDGTNHRLGIGNAAPGTPLDVTGVARATNVTISAMTQGSVLFAGASGAVSQDNATYFWDNTNKRLAIGHTSPAAPLDIRVSFTGNQLINLVNTATDGYTDIVFNKSDASIQGALGYGNATVGITHLRNLNFWYSAVPVDWVFANATQVQARLGATTNQAFLELPNGGSAASGASSTGRLAYFSSSQAFKVANNAGSYLHVAFWNTGVTGTPGAAGVIPFASGSTNGGVDSYFTGNTPATDRGLVWDNTNKKMGIGVSVPGSIVALDASLYVRSHANNQGAGIILIASQSNSYANIDFYDSAKAIKGAVGFADSGVGTTLANRNFFYSPGGVDWVMSDSTTDWMHWYLTTNSFGVEFANGGSGSTSLANTGKLRYNTTGQKFQVSFNTGSYFDMATYAAALTSGQVQFANGSNQLAGSANLFWDNSNTRLGLGTNSPQNLLHLSSGGNTIMRFNSTLNTALSTTDYYDDTGTLVARIGYGNTGVVDPKFTSRFFLKSTGSDIVFVGTEVLGVAGFTFRMQDTETSLQMRAGDSATVGAASTAKLRYNAGTDKLQVSKNGAAYVDIV